MIVECPACHTRYRVDSRIAVAGETSFECSQSQCGHIFVYSPPLLWKGNVEEPPVAYVSDQPPAAFPSQQQQVSQQDEPDYEPEHEFDQSALESTEHPGSAEYSGLAEQIDQAQHNQIDQSEQIEKDDEDTEDTEEADEHVPVFFREEEPPLRVIPKPPVVAEDMQAGGVTRAFSPPIFAASESTDYTDYTNDDDAGHNDIDDADEENGTFLPLRTIVFALGLFVLGYAGIGYYALSHPHATKLALLQVPILGPSFATEEFSNSHIKLTGLSGGFWLSKDNRRIFAVSGTAVNKASVSAKLIQIESAIYDPEGKRIGRKKIFCGNAATETALDSLTVREIDMLQKLAPPKDFILLAGHQTECLTVFTKPPASIAELEGQVVSAQFRDAEEPVISAQFEEETARQPRL